MNSPAVDHDIRLQALSPAHSFIVQAPAGSGKTELLAQRYLRLLALVPQPEQVLAITFTRKAASEMSNRILQALKIASESPRPEQAHKALTWDLAQAVLEKDRQQQWHLLSHPSRLRIQTMDALNASLARRLPILSGTGTVLEIATDVADIYESAAKALIAQLGEDDDISAQLEIVLLHVANRVPALIEMLVDLLQRRDQWLPFVNHHSSHEQREKIEQTLCAAITHHLQLLRVSIPEMAHQELVEMAKYAANNRLSNNPKAELEPLLHACAELEAMPGTSEHDITAWRGIASVLCTQEGHFYNSLTKTQGFPTTNPEAKHRMEALLNVFKDISGLADLFNGVHLLPSPHYSDAQWQVLTALLKVLPQAVAW
ncbi:MAG TPA: UvrD-helicase domain-containing protein, partial [Steroidobacteraceae bacterium]|nr:UvrD-helicase domain-containing protein [Steroidobacteraceae bacterium]